MNDLKSLRYFIEISRLGSFRAAAKSLHITSPALSKSIASLERQLNLRVFIRTTRQLHLTGEGRLIFDRLARCFDGIRAAIEQVGKFPSRPREHADRVMTQRLKTLRQFVALAQHGSFVAAASQLGIRSPALSKSITLLESQLATRLFTRSTRKVLPTIAGHALYAQLKTLFDHIQETLNRVQAARGEPTGVVRLSTVTTYGKSCVVPLLPELFARHAGIDLVMSFHDGARGITRQAYDIRINWGEEREKNKVAQLLCTMPLVLVASPDYLARSGVPRRPLDLANHECIATARPNGARAHWIFVRRRNRQRRSPGKRFEIIPKGRLLVLDENEAVVDAARAGLGLTVMSADAILDQLQHGSLVRLLKDYDISGNHTEEMEIIVQYPTRKYLPLRVRVVVDFLLQKLRGRSPLEVVSDRR